MASVVGTLVSEVGLTAGVAGAVAGAGIAKSPNDPNVVAQNVLNVIGETYGDVFGSAFGISTFAAKKSGMTVSQAIGTGLKNAITQPVKVLQASSNLTKGAQLTKLSSQMAGQKAAQLAAKGAELTAKGTAQASTLGVNASVLGSSGPVGWAILAIQLAFAVIDILWNPFATYFNKDLAEIKESMDASIRKQFLEYGSEYPLEIKPNIMPTTEQELTEFRKYIKEYYDNNGLILSEDVIKEENIYQILNLLNRNMDYALNPLYSNITLLSGTNQNIAILIAASAAKKKGYGQLNKAIDIDYENYEKSKINSIQNYIKLNWQLILSIIILIIISLISIIYLMF